MITSQSPYTGDDARIWRHFEEHSRTFSLAARLLPQHMRLPIAVIYYFCRTVDNVADCPTNTSGDESALRELLEIRKTLAATFTGHPPAELLWQRLGDVIHQFLLPETPFFELIEGATWDLEGRGIENEAELIAYSNLVGGSVGAMMLPFLTEGKDDLRALEPAARALGTAMQITNIVRDVGEDLHTLGRMYIPQSMITSYGLSVADLSEGRIPQAYPAVIEAMMELAEQYYEIGIKGIVSLPLRVRSGIRSAAYMYREILNEVRALSYDNLQHRAYVPRHRKARIIFYDGYEQRKASIRQTTQIGWRTFPLQSVYTPEQT